MSEVTQHAISRFPVPELADMPEDIRDRILAVQEKAGFVPNVFLVLAHRPEEFRAFFAYHDALMEKPGNLSIAEREMIVVATSNLNQCQYCVVAHGAILRIREADPLIADQLAVNYRKADITPRQRAIRLLTRHIERRLQHPLPLGRPALRLFEGQPRLPRAGSSMDHQPRRVGKAVQHLILLLGIAHQLLIDLSDLNTQARP